VQGQALSLRQQRHGRLEAQLKQADADGARFKLIATDGVFSMDGVIADLKSICDLADKYDALVMVDDSHAVGFIGENGRGTHEYCGVMDGSTSSPAPWARRWAARPVATPPARKR
jgi:7-keto-8-aminopelargonate synthetase-like enzyme